MRREFAVPIAIATAALGLGLFAPTQAIASCVGPSIAISGLAPTPVTVDGTTQDSYTVAPEAQVRVTGTFFFLGCNDTGGGGGCSGPSPEATKPDSDVPLVLTQGARSWTLGTSDASGESDSWSTRWDIQLPPDAQLGPATLTARSAAVALTIE